MKGVIDRFEGNYAVIVTEEEKIIKIDIKFLPDNAKESDFIIINDTIVIDTEETEKREKMSRDMLDYMEK